MAYSPQWNHLRTQILEIANEVKQQFPNDWDALTRKDTAYIRRVAFACQQAGLTIVGLNGKRGNVNDLSSDVLAFPNPSGCPDKAGKFSGLELHDIIAAVEDPTARHLTWGDATPETIEAGVGGAWVTPAAVGGALPPPPPPPPPPATLPSRDEMEDEGRWLSFYYAQPEGLQRPLGASIGGAPDWEAVGAHLFDTYLKARIKGKNRADARAEYVRNIRHSHEWGVKHPGETP
jgi:hypothetical protein